jgi:hypothetical protein
VTAVPAEVIQQPDANTLSRLLSERFGKLEADLIPMDNVRLEMDRVLGGRDGLEPRGIVLFPILQNSYRVSRDERRTCGSRKRLVGEGPSGGEGRVDAPIVVRASSLVPPEPTNAEPALARHVDAQRQANSLTHADGRLSFCTRTVVVAPVASALDDRPHWVAA